MGIMKKIAVSAGKKAAEIAKDKAKKILTDEKNIERATEIISKATSQNEKIKPEKVVNVAKKSVAAVKETVDIFKSQKVLAKLQQEGKITQDILDALICDNKEKLEIACREAIKAEAEGNPLPYLSDDEVKSALSFRKALTKSAAHKIVTKI